MDDELVAGGQQDQRGEVRLAPVLALARGELRHRWRALLLLGLLGGLIGTTVVGAAALARRTTTAYERLGAATAIDPRLHVNVSVIAAGVALTALALLVIGVATGELVRRRRSQPPLGERCLVERASRVGSPEATVGLRFALEPGRGHAAGLCARRSPLRSLGWPASWRGSCSPAASTASSGRLPHTPDEVLLGLRAADELATDVGDTATVVERGGNRRSLAVVGTAVVPTFDGEQLGLNAVLTGEGFERSGLAAPFTGAAVTARAGVEPSRLVEHLAEHLWRSTAP